MIFNILSNGNVYDTCIYGKTKGVNAYFGKDVQHVHIYNKGGILLTFNRVDWDIYNTESDTLKSVNHYNDNIYAINLQNDFKRALKVNFERTDNFFVNYQGKYSFENGIDLYINSKEIGVEFVGDYIAMKGEHETNYKTAYAITLNNGGLSTIYNTKQYPSEKRGELEKAYPCSRVLYNEYAYGDIDNPIINVFDNSKYFELAKQHGKTPKGLETGVELRYTTTENIQQGKVYIVAPYCYSMCVEDDFRLENRKIAEALKGVGLDISHYGVEKIKQVCNIELKG